MSLISYLTKIHLGDVIVEEALATEVELLGAQRPMIVTDTGIVEAGLLERIQSALPDPASCVVFEHTPENPDEASAQAAAAAYREHGCDSLIGLGGGAPLDLVKAIGILVSHGGPLAKYAAVEGGKARIRNILPPIIAIPSTAGTGSEVGGEALIELDDGRRLGILSPHLIPKVAICDPTLTLGLPPGLTADSGMDAITHCIETYISTAYNPPADGIALDGLRRAAVNIERAVAHGSDLEARREMMAAAINGALAFQKGLGGVHAMSHALGSLEGFQPRHGALNAILLPYMIEFNAPAVGHRYGALKQAMGMRDRSDFPGEMFKLTERLGLPVRLSELGFDQATVDRAAMVAEKDYTNRTNPRHARAAEYRRIMRAAL